LNSLSLISNRKRFMSEVWRLNLLQLGKKNEMFVQSDAFHIENKGNNWNSTCNLHLTITALKPLQDTAV
jgi:hypothetical protein